MGFLGVLEDAVGRDFDFLAVTLATYWFKDHDLQYFGINSSRDCNLPYFKINRSKAGTREFS